MAFTTACKYPVKCYRQNNYGRGKGITVLNQFLLEVGGKRMDFALCYCK